MYKKDSKIIVGKQDLSNYIEGYDLYNSTLVSLLSDPSIERECYTITNYAYRPDLIAREFYGDTKYLGILYLTCGIDLDSYSQGTVLSLIPKLKIIEILNEI